MIQKLLLLCGSLLTFALITAGKDGGETVLKASGSHISSTGAPGEQTCAQSGCHVDATLNLDNDHQVSTLLLGTGETTYKPNTLYSMSLKAIKAETRRFGFQIVALDTNGLSVGTLSVPSGNTKVQRQKGAINGSDRFYITHTTSGNKPPTTGEIEWKFNWTSPPTYAGEVTFYYCVNATNMDNTNAGDQLYFGVVPYSASSTGIEEHDTPASQLDLYPTIASDYLTVNYTKGFQNQSSCRIVSVTGEELYNQALQANTTSAQIPVRLLPSGCYMLHVVSGGMTITKQFVVQR